MSARGYIFGHAVYYDDGWRYADTHEPATTDRPCPKCGECETADGHDPCIANLPGVTAACCGHGVHAGYVLLTDGTCIEGTIRTGNRPADRTGAGNNDNQPGD